MNLFLIKLNVSMSKCLPTSKSLQTPQHRHRVQEWDIKKPGNKGKVR